MILVFNSPLLQSKTSKHEASVSLQTAHWMDGKCWMSPDEENMDSPYESQPVNTAAPHWVSTESPQRSICNFWSADHVIRQSRMRSINRVIKWNEQSKTSLRYQSEWSASWDGLFRLQSTIRLILDWRIQIQIDGQKECSPNQWIVLFLVHSDWLLKLRYPALFTALVYKKMDTNQGEISFPAVFWQNKIPFFVAGAHCQMGLNCKIPCHARAVFQSGYTVGGTSCATQRLRSTLYIIL